MTTKRKYQDDEMMSTGPALSSLFSKEKRKKLQNKERKRHQIARKSCKNWKENVMR